MARPRKSIASFGVSSLGSSEVSTWAETLGEALGRGVARGLNNGLSASPFATARTSPGLSLKRRDGSRRSSNSQTASDRQCRMDGCGRDARSKGLCSAHYQAERRRLQAKA